MADAISVRLPYPPSVNASRAAVRGRLISTAQYRNWLQAASWEVKRVVSMTYDRKGVKGPYAISVRVCPPDKRKRDLGNLEKAVSDALVRGGAVEDDCLCQRIELEWCGESEGVRATVMSTKLRINS
jgi:crossover junction endodeoxyribonuclease RusA